jgi:SulP family sulfate permease
MQDGDIIFRKDVPSDVAIFEINGPFFFAVSNLLNDEMRQLRETPKYFILRMRKVPLIDASGLHALKLFQEKCKQRGIAFLLSGVQKPVKDSMQRSGIVDEIGEDHFFSNLNQALDYCRAER